MVFSLSFCFPVVVLRLFRVRGSFFGRYEQSILDGLPELTELNMYGNKVAAVVIPHDKEVLGKLEVLNLGYNDLAYLPDELDQLRYVWLFASPFLIIPIMCRLF